MALLRCYKSCPVERQPATYRERNVRARSRKMQTSDRAARVGGDVAMSLLVGHDVLFGMMTAGQDSGRRPTVTVDEGNGAVFSMDDGTDNSIKDIAALWPTDQEVAVRGVWMPANCGVGGLNKPYPVDATDGCESHWLPSSGRQQASANRTQRISRRRIVKGIHKGRARYGRSPARRRQAVPD